MGISIHYDIFFLIYAKRAIDVDNNSSQEHFVDIYYIDCCHCSRIHLLAVVVVADDGNDALWVMNLYDATWNLDCRESGGDECVQYNYHFAKQAMAICV